MLAYSFSLFAVVALIKPYTWGCMQSAAEAAAEAAADEEEDEWEAGTTGTEQVRCVCACLRARARVCMSPIVCTLIVLSAYRSA
jgi:hypothetical protein